MIHSKDRSYYIGASDTSYVMRSWETKTFDKWWLVKQGYIQDSFQSDAMIAGTYFEHRILDRLNIEGMNKDKQIVNGRLRVNLDGNTDTSIYEVKTYRFEKGFKVSKSYEMQVNVEMYASGIHQAFIVAYGLEEDDYRNFYREIESDRLSFHRISYDEKFISEYASRLLYLSDCLERGKFPNLNEYEDQRHNRTDHCEDRECIMRV